MKKQFLSIILLMNTVSLIAMEGSDDDKQVTPNMAALTIESDQVDAWDALGKEKKKEVRSTLEKWAKKYNEYYSKEEPERVLNEEQFKKAVKQAYKDIKIDIRRNEGTLPINPNEAEEKKYYYEDFLKNEIQMIRFPGAVCRFNVEPEVISDSEDEK